MMKWVTLHFKNNDNLRLDNVLQKMLIAQYLFLQYCIIYWYAFKTRQAPIPVFFEWITDDPLPIVLLGVFLLFFRPDFLSQITIYGADNKWYTVGAVFFWLCFYLDRAYSRISDVHVPPPPGQILAYAWPAKSNSILIFLSYILQISLLHLALNVERSSVSRAKTGSDIKLTTVWRSFIIPEINMKWESTFTHSYHLSEELEYKWETHHHKTVIPIRKQ